MPNTTAPPASLELCTLRAAFGKHAKKTVRRTAEGVFKVADYTKGLSKWTRHPVTLPFDIDALADFISQTAADPSACLVTGIPSGSIPLDQPAPRWKVDHRGEDSATLAECSAPWLPVDLDDIPTGIRLDPMDPEAAIQAGVDLLGSPFNAASFVWQLTSQATPGSTRVRARVYFLADQAITNYQRRAWAKALNQRTGLKLTDPSLYTCNQAIYSAHPEFVDGSTDPFPRRIGVVYGEHEAVPWGAVETLTADTELSYTGTRTGGPVPVGIDERLARIGDGPGREGIDGPVYESVVAMVREKWMPERIIEVVTDAVMNAPVDPSKHSVEYLARKTHPREIRRNIKNAERYLKRTETLPRVTQTRPVLEGEALPLGEAERRMQQAAADFFASDAPGHTVILGTVGLGKTRSTLEARPAGAKVLWAHATHSQGQEVVERINGTDKPHIAIKIEGRAGHEGRDGLCKRQAHLAALKDAGKAHLAERILCDSGTARCEHIHSCGYLAQFRRGEEARLVPHAYLGGDMHRSKVYKNDFMKGLAGAVIDENPMSEMVGRAAFLLADIQAHAPILASVLATIQAGEEIDPGALAQLEAERLALSEDEFSLPVAGAGPADDSLLLAELTQLAKRHRPTYAAAYKAVIEHQAGAVNMLWFGTDGEGRARVFTAWRSDLHPKITRALFLDATGNEDVYRALLGEDTQFVRINAHQNLEIIQASDAVMGKRRIVPTGDEPGDDATLARVAGLVHLLGNPGKTAVITNKAAEDALEARGYLPAGTQTAHFGALRGLNRLEDCETLVIAGRPEPPPLEVEAIARALWPREALNFTGRYVWRQDGLLSVASHEDARCDAVLRMIREGEVMQAIGRLRAVRSDSIKRVIVLTSTPIDLPVTHKPLTEILPPEGLARLLIAGDGVAPMVPSFMVRMVPGFWRNERAAEEDIRRNLKPAIFYYKTIYYGIAGFKFRQRDQRRHSWALSTRDTFDTWATLEKLAGGVVVECQPVQPPDTANQAPQAQADAVSQHEDTPAWTKPAFTVRTFADPPPSAPLAGTWGKPAFTIRRFVDVTPSDFTRHWQRYRTPIPDHQLLSTAEA